MAGRGTPPHPTAQLVELREPEPLGVLDDHEARPRHIHAHLDHGGGDQQIDLACLEARHQRRALATGLASVHQPHAQLGERLGQFGGDGLGSLRLQ